VVDLDYVKRWLRDAPSGDKIVYHTGFLAADRVVREMQNGKLKDRYIEPINHIGDLMEMAQDTGKVVLWQERVAEFEYKYWARKL